MNKKIIKSIVIIGTILATMIILTTISNAASLNISTSKSSVSPGEVFIVTVTLDGGAGPVSASASNGTGSGSQFLDNSSLSFSCTAGSSGTVTISASGTVGDYATETDVYVSQSKTVNIVVPTTTTPSTNTGSSSTGSSSSSGSSSSTKPSTNTSTTKPSTTTTTVTKSSNSKLSSLEIAEGAITPEFSSGTKEYSISVPNEVTKLSISAVADSSKATVKITGNEELQVGENNIEVIVTAEDGSKTTYKILAKRAQPALNLQALTVSYVDENGERVELLLNPVFSFDIYEYKIDTIIPHTIKNLEIVGTANRENANIEIVGNEELKTGENVITIKVTVADEAGLEEQKTYTIKVEKEEEAVVAPLSTKEKIGKWFSGIGAWISQNYEKITTGMLLFATTAFVGLTIYFIYDYKNYKKVLAKLAELNKSNLMGRANVALDPELANPIEENNNIEQIETIEKQEENIIEENTEKEEAKIGKGRRFK